MPLVLLPGQDRLRRKGASLSLAFFWFGGLVCGTVMYLSADSASFLWMRRLPFASVSIIELLCVTLIPVLASIAADYLHVLFLLYPICFLKALQFSFVACGIVSAFTDAGWMICLFLLFHDLLTTPFLYYYWKQCLRGRSVSPAYPGFLFSTAFLICSVDYRLILPFWASLIGGIFNNQKGL